MTKILEVEGLKVQFYTQRGIVNAVNDVSFDVSAGEIVGIIGESGSGKSITCRSIMGLVPYPGKVAGGRILFEENDLLEQENLKYFHYHNV